MKKKHLKKIADAEKWRKIESVEELLKKFSKPEFRVTRIKLERLHQELVTGYEHKS